MSAILEIFPDEAEPCVKRFHHRSLSSAKSCGVGKHPPDMIAYRSSDGPLRTLIGKSYFRYCRKCHFTVELVP